MNWKTEQKKERKKNIMSDMIFELVKVAVMLVALVAARYIIPWIKDKVGADQLAFVADLAKKAVLYAQQTMWSETGAERKAVVTQILKELLMAKNISISDEQLDILIEAAVKEMKISEAAGVTIMPGIEVEDDRPDEQGKGAQLNQGGILPCISAPQTEEA